MQWNSFWRRFRSLFFREMAAQELDEELSSHLEFQFQKHLAEGLGEKEARRRARIEFGAVEAAREECREVDRWHWIEAAARNMKYCFRSLSKSPLIAVIAILILTISIGSVLAAFSIIDALLFRPLDVENPNELIKIALVVHNGHLLEMPFASLEFLQKNRTIQSVCGIDESPSGGVEMGGDIRAIGVARFSGDCFAMLGLHFQIGRGFTSAHDRVGTSGVAVITDSLWQSAYGGRPDILGKLLKIDNHPYTIIGVTQKRFRGLVLSFPQDVMIPLLQRQMLTSNGAVRTSYWVSVLARRAPGVSESQARASILAQKTQLLEATVLQSYNAALRKDYLARGLSVLSGRSGIDYQLRRRFGEPLAAVFGICSTLLLIGCVNLISLFLARSLNRRHEVSIRLALGAKRSHVATLFILEATVLIFAGAALGTMAGLGIAQAVNTVGSQIFGNFYLNVGLDVRSMALLTLMITFILAGFSIASIWQANRLATSGALKGSGRGVVTTNNIAQRILIGAQLALTLALVTASTLLAASLKNMYGIDFGIKARNLWEIELAGRHNHPGSAANYRALRQEVESLPEVQSATLSGSIPFYSYDYREPVAILGTARLASEVQARQIDITDHFFATVGAKIIAGEDFRSDDTNSVDPAVIISESLARHFASPEDVIGRRLKMGDIAGDKFFRIVGVASNADLNLTNLDDTKPYTVYFNLLKVGYPLDNPILLVRTQNGVLPISELRRAARQNGYDYIDRATTVSSEIDNALVENRLLAYLSEAFSVLALLMAAVGLFGLLSYQVSNRTGEIGVRMALGAQRAQIQWLILSQVTRLLALGGVVGLALTLAAGKAVASLLYGVGAYDFAPLLFSAAVLAATALTAAWIPVRRASSIDPLVALRHE